MTTVVDPNTLLMGGGGRSAKFENEGDTVIGYIARVETRQRTEIGTGHPMTWPDGNPRMQLVIQVLIDAPEDDDDDGLRNLYVSIPSQMQKVIADAVRKVGERGLGNGGKLGVKYSKTEAPKQRGFNGQKIYTAKYEPPVYAVPEDTIHQDDDAEPF